MKPTLQIPACIDSLRTLKDGSVKIAIETQELRPEDFAVLAQYRNVYGFLLFKETQFQPEDIADVPEVVPEFKTDKTPSQRLRGVLFVLWESLGKPGDFDAWYKTKMNQIIEHYKAKLP